MPYQKPPAFSYIVNMLKKSRMGRFFCEKILMKIKISLRRSVEKLKSRDNSPLPARYQSKHKRYLYLFVCLGVFISAIKLPRIPTYLLKVTGMRRLNLSQHNTKIQKDTKKRSRSFLVLRMTCLDMTSSLQSTFCLDKTSFSASFCMGKTSSLQPAFCLDTTRAICNWFSVWT